MTSVDHAPKPSFWTIGRKWVAGGAAAALIAGTFVYAGIGALKASAAGPKPVVTVSAAETPVLGEDMTVSVGIANPASSNAVYNLSATAMLPESVDVLGVSATNPSGGSVPWDYALYNAGDTLPGAPALGTCAEAGLDGVDAGPCVVPAGMQLLVFENVSDLPASANVNAAIELRPRVNQDDTGDIADGFAVGDPVDVRVNAYTSSDERLLPLFPGSNAKNTNASRDATSEMGVGEAAPEIKALRVTKSEPSPESELLRGVHSNTTIYTLTIDHTGEGDLTNAVVVDYLPSGLEYLGSVTAHDNTTNAGNSDGDTSTGAEEYVGAGDMHTGDAGPNARDASEVDTVELTAAQALDLGLTYRDGEGELQGRAGVYTKVTWKLSEGFLAAGGTVQDATSAGTPATTTISYRAGVPLFENTMEFNSDVTPGTHINGVQGANLDNNNGPSTRHGSAPVDGSKGATSWVNTAFASGSWTGKTGTLTPVTSSDSDTETIDAVDVRILKDVRVGSDGFGPTATFEHGNVADYRLRVATSEYVGVVEVGERPTRLVDDLANGLCPVYPSGDILSPEVMDQGHPNFILGKPDYAAAPGATPGYASLTEWNDALVAAGLSECVWPTSDLASDATFTGATLSGIAFDETTGRFYQDLRFDAANEQALTEPNANVEVIYSVRQNSAYLTTNEDGTGEDGATSSGDVVVNHVELEAKTKTRSEVNGLENVGGGNAGDEYYAWDDSAASVETNYSDMQKYVLRNDPELYPQDATDIWELDYGSDAAAPGDPDYPWTQQDNEPFAVGDDVWFKIRWESANGADVRNPVLTDFLPEGVAFDSNGLSDTNEWQESENLRVFPTVDEKTLSESGITDITLGECNYDLSNPTQVRDAFTEFVGNIELSDSDRRLTWRLGSTKCYDADNPSVSPDKFWPGGLDLDIYIKVTVTDAQAFGGTDITQNLAKYQQENVDGEIFFLRSQAEIVNDQSAKLTKGIRHLKNHIDSTYTPSAAGNSYGSNADGGLAVQGDEVTYRLDVFAPYSETTGYVLWDALPGGVTKTDLKGIQSDGTFASASAATVTQTWSEADGFTSSESAQTGNWTATAYDPLDSDRPDNGEIRADYRDRTIVVWEFNGQVPSSVLPVAADPEADPAITAAPAIPQGLTLGYTVVVPAGTTNGGDPAVIGQEYVNDASIKELKFKNNGGGNSTLLLNGSASGPSVALPRTDNHAGGVYGFDDAADEASDPSNFEIRGATMGKALHASEIEAAEITPADSNNPKNVIVQGEYAEFDISATIPAHTTVLEGLLKDDGVLRWGGNQYEYQFVEAELVAPTPVPSGVTLEPSDGSLSFGTSYTNATTADQTFTVRLKVWVGDADESRPDVTPDFADGTVLTNTARFSYETIEGDTASLDPATAAVTYREPVPTLQKATVGDSGGANGTVRFRLTAGNEAGQPTLYDAVVYDCLPAGFSEPDAVDGGWNFSSATGVTVGGSCSVEGTDADQRVVTGNGDGTLITWNVGHLAGGTNTTLEFTAKIDEKAGGGATYTNRAHIVGYTLPSTLDSGDPAVPGDNARRGDRAVGVERNVPISPASISKSVTPTSAPVGDTVTYQVTATFPANANFYDVTLTDRLPAGVEYVDGQDVIVDFGGNWSAAPTISAPNVTGVVASGQTLEWIVAPDDIATHTEARTITITFDARITNAVAQSATRVTNHADLTWHIAENPSSGTTPQRSTDDAVVTILNPVLGIAKDVRFNDAQGTSSWNATRVTGNPDRGLEYRVIVRNTGNTASYNNVIVDTLPAGVVNPANFTINGSPVTGAVWNSAARTITWTLPDAIAAGGQVTLGYTAQFAPSASLESNTNGQGDDQLNTAAVTHFESFEPDSNGNPTGREYNPTNVRDTANARAQFPRVTLTKSAADTTRTAYVGEPFEWVLTATNSNQGAAQKVVLSDVLPANWVFDEMVSVTVAGNADTTPRVPSGVGTSVDPLKWTFGSDAAGGSPAAILQPGQSIVVRYTAIPLNPEALTEPGVGSSVRHVNTLSAVTTDRTDSDRNATRTHTGPNVSDYAFLGKADLVLEKNALGGVTNPAAFGDLAVGTWIAGQTAGSGYDQPKWQVIVKNHGDDPAFGPFVIADTPPTPTGVTEGTWTARYHSGRADTTGTVVGAYPAGTTSFSIDIGATRSLATNGSNWVSLTTDVTVGANAVSEASGDLELTNTASVRGKTYEDPDDFGDNEDTETKQVEELADLEVRKRITDPTTGSIAVGESITYTVDARNNGPSVSRGDITITDTIPSGLSQVYVTDSGDWVVTAINGEAATAADAITAGDTVTWTYQGDPMLVNTLFTAGVTINATIDRSFTGELVNWAQVHPGLTHDPDYVENPGPGYDDQNNRDDARITPNDDTVVSVDKVRVVADSTAASGWRQADPTNNPGDAFVAGDPVHYLITVTNAADRADARSVKVVDESPVGITYTGHVGIDSSAWTRAAGGANLDGASESRWNTFTMTTPATLAESASQSFVVTYDTATTVTGDVENWAEVTIGNWDRNDDPEDRRDRDDDSTGATRIVDLGIVKSHDPDAPLTPGTEVAYTLVVTNHGTSATNGAIEIEDVLPAGLSYVPNSASVAVSNGTVVASPAPVVSGGSTLSWSLLSSTDVFDRGDTITITYRALIDQNVRASVPLTNTVTVEGPDNVTEPTPDPNPNEDDDTITTGPLSATMEIEKTVAPGPWIAGETATYTLTVKNFGPSAAPATVVDPLVSGLSYISMSGAGWECAETDGVPSGECAYTAHDGLHPAGSATNPAVSTITVVARIDAAVTSGTALDNIATLTWVDNGTKTDDDDAQITVTTRADLVLTKTAVDEDGEPIVSAVAGGTALYSLSVYNDGPSAVVAPLSVVDTLPEGASFARVVGSGWTATSDADAGTVTFVRNPLSSGLAAGATAPEILFEVIFDADLPVTDADATPAVQPLVNTATVTSGTPETNVTNNTDDAALNIVRESNVSVDKGHTLATPVDEFEIGDEVEFTFDVTNDSTGPSNASGIVVTDTLPAGLTFTGIDTASGWSLVSNVVNEDGTTTVVASYAGEVAPGAATPRLTLSALVTVEIGDNTEVTNSVCVTGLGNGETNTNADPCDTDTITVVPLANLTLGKTAVTPADEINAGEAITWLLTPRNEGPSVSLSTESNPITVTDTLPAGIDRLVSDPSNADWAATTSNDGGWSEATAGDTITWTYLGDRFLVGAEPDIEITAVIDAAWYDAEIVNTAVLTAGVTTDPELPNEGTSTIDPGDRTSIDIWKNRVVEVNGEWVPAASIDPVPSFRPGTDITYRIDVANDGPAVARDVQVVDPIPAGLSNPIVTNLDGLGTWSAETVTCEAGLADLSGYPAEDCLVVSLDESLLVGLSEMRSFLVTFSSDPALDPADDVVNWAQARATNVSEDERPNDDDSTQSVPGADLSIVKTVLQDRVLAGTTVDYRLSVINHGQSIARGPVTVSDRLPVGLGYVPGTATVSVAGAAPVAVEPTVTETAGSEQLSWTVLEAGEALDVDGTIVIELQTQLAEGVFSADGLVNTARVFADAEYDYDPTNNESSATVVVDPLVTLSVEKTAVNEFQVGKTGEYQIAVTNSGPTAEPGTITVTDVLPDGLTFHSSPDGATVSGKTVTWVLPEGLDVGESVTLTLYVNVHQAAYPEVTNVVTIDSPSEKTPESKLVDDETVEVRALDVLSYTGGAAVGYLAIFAALLMLGGAVASATGARRKRGRYAA